MEIISATAQLLGVNCYAIASEAPVEGTRECVLVDAGLDGSPELDEQLRELDWKPVAILITHGHPDHVLGLPAFLERWDVPVLINTGDHYRLVDPAGTLPGPLADVLGPVVAEWQAPPTQTFEDGAQLDAAGLQIHATSAPGHTQGSTLYEIVDPAAAEGPSRVMFSGDVLFAGSIGRTDLPDSDPAAMQDTLRALSRRGADGTDMQVLPGHGPATTLSHELRTNPFF